MATINLGRVRGIDGRQGIDGAPGAPGPQGPEGPQGPKGEPGSQIPLSDSVISPDSGVAASSLAVKTAYDLAVSARDAATDAVTDAADLASNLAAKRFYQVAASDPSDTNLLWVNSENHVIHYHNGSAWVPVTAVYAENAGV